MKGLTARLRPHFNHDKMRHTIRKDSATAQFDVIRLLLCLAAISQFRLGYIDIRDAYFPSRPIRRDSFVRPPHEMKDKRGKLWWLTKLPYGIIEAG